jgi:predicted nucleic acid-binding protein
MGRIERVLIDSDVLLDYLSARQPFFDDANTLFNIFFKKQVELYATSVAIANDHYILSKREGVESSRYKISILLANIQVLPTKHKAVATAFATRFKDHEDAIQYFTAIDSGKIDAICTRNIKDFPKGKIPVLSPPELTLRLKA